MAIDFSATEFETEEFEPLVTTSLTGLDEGEQSLRPKTLADYIGQEKAKIALADTVLRSEGGNLI